MQADKKTTVAFSIRLDTMMGRLNLSQAQVAEAGGVSRGAVSKWLKGNTPPGSLELWRLACYFSVPMEWLLGEGGTAAEVQAANDARAETVAGSDDQKYRDLRAGLEELLGRL